MEIIFFSSFKSHTTRNCNNLKKINLLISGTLVPLMKMFCRTSQISWCMCDQNSDSLESCITICNTKRMIMNQLKALVT